MKFLEDFSLIQLILFIPLFLLILLLQSIKFLGDLLDDLCYWLSDNFWDKLS